MTISPEVASPAQTILGTLTAHGVKARYATVFAGPTITQYAYTLTAGVPLKKVTALSKDIALALGLDEVRIVAPIPGTSFVGVEVPSETRETVTYEDFVDGANDHDVATGAALPIPVGVNVRNEPVWADLAKLPHLLIAGQTGSGKSVAVTGIIASLIDHRSPDEVRLRLIDPKRVELAGFMGAPHVEQVATDPLDAADLLADVVAIMDSRYKQFEKSGCRNITEFNRDHGDPANETTYAGHLPYQVVVVDELADLMMTGGKDIESDIVRIAQLGRAAGIHLVLATQRPTKDVVTGLISANVPSRWAFSVRSTVDSMVALDQPGANALYGGGDSLWLPAGADKPQRVQGVYTSSEKVAELVSDAVVSYESYASTSSPDAAEDDDDIEIDMDDVDGELERAREAAERRVTATPADVVAPRHARVRDRSESWLDTPAPRPEAETPDDWAAEMVSDEANVEGAMLADIQALRYRLSSVELQLVHERNRGGAVSRWWRNRNAFTKGAIVGLGGIITIGWVGNIIEAVAA